MRLTVFLAFLVVTLVVNCSSFVSAERNANDDNFAERNKVRLLSEEGEVEEERNPNAEALVEEQGFFTRIANIFKSSKKNVVPEAEALVASRAKFFEEFKGASEKELKKVKNQLPKLLKKYGINEEKYYQNDVNERLKFSLAFIRHNKKSPMMKTLQILIGIVGIWLVIYVILRLTHRHDNPVHSTATVDLKSSDSGSI